VTRLLGAIGLLLRRAWALPLYIISVVFFLGALYRAFVLANVSSVMSGAHISVELVFLALSIFAVWFARENKSKGILK
jgi:K+ transporter